MTIKAIPGLGLDARIFDEIKSISDIEIIAYDHLEPRLEESWEGYVIRLRSYIDLQEDDIVMGHSFGGILTQELAQLQPIKGSILVSTITSSSELPPTLAVMRSLPAYQLLRRALMKRTYWIWGEKDGYNTPEQRSEYYDMTDKLSDYYFQWSVKHIVHWSSDHHPNKLPILRLHGSNDAVFPIKYITKDSAITIDEGSHVMVKSKAIEIVQHITRWAKTLP